MPGLRAVQVQHLQAALIFAALLCAPLAVAAQDAERGRLLYETHCGACHAGRLHERARSKVHSLEELRDTVEHWAQQARRSFSADEVDDLLAHLNAKYYRFNMPAHPVRR